MSKKTKVLVCGATGFIGRNIAESLSLNNDFEVIGVFNKRPSYECSNLEWIKNSDHLPMIVDLN